VETKRFVSSNVNVILDAANMQPLLEHVCEKQTPSARKIFFEANLPNIPDIKM